VSSGFAFSVTLSMPAIPDFAAASAALIPPPGITSPPVPHCCALSSTSGCPYPVMQLRRLITSVGIGWKVKRCLVVTTSVSKFRNFQEPSTFPDSLRAMHPVVRSAIVLPTLAK